MKLITTQLRSHIKPAVTLTRYILCGVLLLCAMPKNTEASTKASSEHNRPPHHTADGFRNLYSESRSSNRRRLSLKDMRRGFAMMREREQVNTAHAELVPKVEADLDAIHHPKEQPQITWIGHSTVLIQYQGINIITDPIFSGYCGPVAFLGPKRLTSPAINIKQLPHIDYVLISHNHYDHLDLATVRHLRNEPVWLVPLGIKAWLKRVGVKSERVVELDWWEAHHPQEHLTITATPAQHWSRRGINDYNRTLWGSWHVSLGKFNLWFGGDTGYNEHQFVAIGERLPQVDIALIPIGAYEPQNFMRISHISPREAVQIFQDIKARSAIGIHWGTFSLSAEPLLAPISDLEAAAQLANLKPEQFVAPVLGRTFTVTPKDTP